MNVAKFSGPDAGLPRRSPTRLSFGVFALVLALQSWGPIALAATLDEPMEFNIPRHESLEDALINWGFQVGVTVMINTKAVDGYWTNGLHGKYSAREALILLLHDSGLSYSEEGGRVKIVKISSPLQSNATASGELGLTAWSDRGAPEESSVISDGVNDRETDDTSSRKDHKDLEEVVITAQKREERLLDVPIPVAAVNTSQLVDSNQLKLQDYYTQIPSLSFSEGEQSSQQLVIRGLAASNFVDDLPIGGALPDIDPGNLQRIEVLRGPQGTLYGASGLGGVVKFITIDPSTDGISGRLEVGSNTVYNGYDLGYTTRGSINLPITSDLAVRAGAFWRQDAGYLDNPLLGINGINRDSAKGGQFTALWTPSRTLSLRLTALYQEIQGGSQDSTIVNSLQEAAFVNGVTPTPPPALGNLEQEYVAGTGPYERMYKAFGLTFKTTLGPVNVTSVSGYTSDSFHDYFDYTVGLGGPGPNSVVYQQFGVEGAPIFTSQDARGLSEELRFSGSITSFFDWTLGLYYKHTNTPFFDEILATNPTTGQLAGVDEFFSTPSISTTRDAFSNFTFHVTDRLDIQVGGRESYQVGSSPNNVWTGPYNLAQGVCPTLSCPQTDYPSHSHAFTYLFTPSYKFSADLMLYARLASAFIGGGQNNGAGPGAPPTFGPEKTKNYEIGLKGVMVDGALSFDVSLYTIDFVGLQNEFYNATSKLSYTANAGAAVSRGIELSTQANPTSDTNIDAWVVLSDAHLTDIPLGVSTAEINGGLQPETVGEPLPDSDRFSANLAVTQNFSLPGSWKGFAGGAISYIGQRAGPFTAGPQATYPCYAKMDFRAGAKHDVWSMNFYVNNIADRRGIVSADNQAVILYNRFYIQPRTIGVSVARTF